MKIAGYLFAALPLLAQQSSLRILDNGSAELRRGAQTAVFRPHFTVVYSVNDPGLRLKHAFWDPLLRKSLTDPEGYALPEWQRAGSQDVKEVVFDAGQVTIANAPKSFPRGGGVQWQFPTTDNFELAAELMPVAGSSEPLLKFRLTPRKPGWYTVGYTGAPEIDPVEADEIWQPLVWQEKRFPRATLLTPEGSTSLPATMVVQKGSALALAVDPAEIPFRLATFQNSRFGVTVRSRSGKAQPAVFAPLFGNADSKMEPGKPFEFRLRPVLTSGNWYEAYRYLARTLFQFADRRENLEISLNDTIANMIDFAMNDAYSGWNADLKGFDYESDVPGTVKVVSALHPFSAALITDDPEIYRRRTVPAAEYLMSRKKYLYGVKSEIRGQGASHDMDGPSAEVSELAGLYQFARGRSPVFRAAALEVAKKPRALNLEMVSQPDTFQSNLALYRLTQEAQYLERSRMLADRYIASRIDTPQQDFSDARITTGGQFWTDFAPQYVELFELWSETGEARYLDAALRGAQRYAAFCWLYPTIPLGTVVVDAEGTAPVGWDHRGGNVPMVTPKVEVPAWTMSQIGLTSEASTTWYLNPAMFMAHHAVWLQRIGYAGNDDFLRSIGRSAVIGRYRNYPGYDINIRYSNVYAREDFPLRRFEELTYNQIYYNHVWPHIAMLLDYLISGIEGQSGKQISFPARYAPGYAYLQSRVYGDREGTFYGDRTARLWMPSKLLLASHPQLNHISAYGRGNLYLAFTNESPREVTTRVRLNPDYALWTAGTSYRVQVWVNGRPSRVATMINGELDVQVSPRGLVAFAIEGLPVYTRLHPAYFDSSVKPLSERSHHTEQASFGKVTGMLISAGRGLTNSFVWLQASEQQIRSATLHYRAGSEWKTMTDAVHPFEFSMPLENSAETFEYRVEATLNTGGTATTKELTLQR